MAVTATTGIDFTLPEPPPLRQPPLSLLDLAPVLVDDEEVASAQEKAQQRAASWQERTADARERLMEAMQGATQGDRDAAIAKAQAALEEAIGELGLADQLATSASERYASTERWEQAFQYLPELPLAASSIFVPGTASPGESTATSFPGTDPTTTNIKPTGNNQTAFAWYDPFMAVGLDSRSAFGWPLTDLPVRQQRALRALLAHECWQVENEWWSGSKVPTNYHLTAAAAGPTTSPYRTIATSTFPNPSAAPTTVLGTAYGLAQSLAALDQAIADSDAGVGMIHATPFVIQSWMKTYPYIRDSNGRVYTVNMNLMVPGFGYPGTGPDTAGRSTSADGHATSGSTIITSASAAFTSSDIGRPISDSLGDIPAGAVIVTLTSPTQVTISVAATASPTTDVFTIGGTGGRATAGTQQWAYATDTVYLLRGGTHVYPWDVNEATPYLSQQNLLEVRAERPWATITNQLLRAAVLVDTTLP